MNKRFLNLTHRDFFTNSRLDSGTYYDFLNKLEDFQVNQLDAVLVQAQYPLFRKSNRIMRSSSKRMRKVINDYLIGGFLRG
jgi:hypothetical protein